MKHFKPITTIDDAIRQRRSVRAFLPTPVAGDVIADLLRLAARAPSGTNMQPWRAYVLDRGMIDLVSGAIEASGIEPAKAEWDDYRYYPERFFEPYLGRRRALGAALYAKLGIGRRDTAKMRAHFRRNFDFFGAPNAIMLTIDRRLEQGSWLDVGMFIQTLLLAAQARGIGTCVQAAFAPFHRQVRPILGMPENEVLVCGIALGFPDDRRAENFMRTERAPLNDWVVDAPAGGPRPAEGCAQVGPPAPVSRIRT